MLFASRVLLALGWLATSLWAQGASSEPADGAVRRDEQPVWFEGSYEAALAEAHGSGRLVMLHITVDWSDWCTRLEQESLAHPGVRAELAHFVCVKVRGDGEFGRRLTERYRIRAFPMLFFLQGDESPEDVIGGYVRPGLLVQELARIRVGRDTLSHWTDRVADQPQDLDARWYLANKYWDLGRPDQYWRQLAYIEAADPGSESMPRRLLMLYDLQAYILESRNVGKAIRLSPLQTFLGEEQHPRVLFEGYSYLAGVQVQMERWQASRDSHRRAWEHVPETRMASFGQAVAWTFWERREELDPAERAFAQEVASRAAERATALADAGFHAACLHTLANCYAMNEELASAIDALERAKSLDPRQRLHAARLEELRSGSGAVEVYSGRQP